MKRKRKLEGKEILVIEDDRRIRQSVRDFLERNGAYVHPYNDGHDAIKDIYNGLKYDVCLTDIAMARCGGEEVAEASKDVNPLIPVVTITESAGYNGRSGDKYFAFSTPKNIDAKIKKFEIEGIRMVRGQDILRILKDVLKS